MSITQPAPMTATPFAPAVAPTRRAIWPQRRLFTCNEFHDMSDRGMFEGENVFLIDGEILQMPAPNPPHDAAVALGDAALRSIFAKGFWVRGQMSLLLGQRKDPVPDLAVVAGTPRDYLQRKPTTAVLVVEVSDSPLAYDQVEKASLYAAAGIADYWIIDIVNRRLEVRRRPQPDATQPHGHSYADVTMLAPGDSIVPLAMPSASIAVGELMP